jgi:hypothetical protein
MVENSPEIKIRESANRIMARPVTLAKTPEFRAQRTLKNATTANLRHLLFSGALVSDAARH